MKVVEVRWLDSMIYGDGWQDAEFYTQMADAPENEHLSVGYVAGDTEKGLLLVANRDASGDRLCQATFIPRAALISVMALAAEKEAEHE